jgi:hypothetical protein
MPTDCTAGPELALRNLPSTNTDDSLSDNFDLLYRHVLGAIPTLPELISHRRMIRPKPEI